MTFQTTAGFNTATDFFATYAPMQAAITTGADAGGSATLNIQLKDNNGDELTTRACIFAYLSDDANGDSVAGTAPDGGVAAGTDGVLIPVVAGKAFMLVSEADGDIDVVVTESATDTWYLVLVGPLGNLMAISDAIAMTA